MLRKLCMLFIAIVYAAAAYAQGGYVKFKEDYQLPNRNIKFFKGEILKYSKQDSTYKIAFQDDSLALDSAALGKVEEIGDATDVYLSNKDSYVKSKDNSVYIDVKSLPGKPRFVYEGQKAIVFDQKKEELISSDKTGENFRLIIPDAPTIFYSLSNLTPVDDIDNRDKADFPWVYLIAGIITLVALVSMLIIYKEKVRQFIRRHTGPKEPVRKQFHADGFSDFISQHRVSQKNFLKWNKDRGLPADLFTLDSKDQKKEKNKHFGKDFIVGYRRKTHEPNPVQENIAVSQQAPMNQPMLPGDGNSQVEELISLSPGKQSPEVAQQLSGMERRIIAEIRNLVSNQETARYINEINEELKNVTEEKSKLENANTQLTIDKSEIEKQLALLQQQNKSLNTKLLQHSDKIIFVEYLRGYCEEALAYLVFCKDVRAHAYEAFNRLNNYKEAAAPAQLLLNFQHSIQQLPIGNWEQILQDIKDTGITANKQLLRSFSQVQDETERKREFQRLLFNEVLIKYSSSVLVLTESFRNIDRFRVPAPAAQDIQHRFNTLLNELLNKVKSLGLETKYVPLFKNYMDYLGQSKSVDEQLSPAYQLVSGLEKDSIAEILAYGFKSTFTQTDTLIILT